MALQVGFPRLQNLFLFRPYVEEVSIICMWWLMLVLMVVDVVLVMFL